MGVGNAESSRYASDHDAATFLSDNGLSHEARGGNVDDGKYEIRLAPMDVPENVWVVNWEQAIVFENSVVPFPPLRYNVPQQ